jgi:AP-1 complex subunit mu
MVSTQHSQQQQHNTNHTKKPKVFLDVVESVHLLVNSDGAAVLSEVHGTLKMRCYLSGMPECKLGLNDKVRGAAH